MVLTTWPHVFTSLCKTTEVAHICSSPNWTTVGLCGRDVPEGGAIVRSQTHRGVEGDEPLEEQVCDEQQCYVAMAVEGVH